MQHLTSTVYPPKRPRDLIPVPVVEALAWLLAVWSRQNPARRRHERQIRAQMRQDRLMGLSSPNARSAAIHAFKHLKYNHYHFDPAEIRAWALAHGWTADDAQQLGDYADGVLAGTRYHTRSDPWGRSINHWREEAAKQHPT